MNGNGRGGHLTPWKKGQSGNPGGRPKTSAIRETFLSWGRVGLPAEIKEVLERGGLKLPKKATFLDGLALMMFARAFRGDASCARVIIDAIGGRIAEPDTPRQPSQADIDEALNKIRQIYGLEPVYEANNRQSR